MRSSTVPRVSPRFHGRLGASGTTMDNPPGQNASTSVLAVSVNSRTSPWMVTQEPTSTGTGMSGPRRLVARSVSTASLLNASQPMPYTVSVGSTTQRPARTASAAARTPSARFCGSRQSYVSLNVRSLAVGQLPG